MTQPPSGLCERSAISGGAGRDPEARVAVAHLAVAHSHSLPPRGLWATSQPSTEATLLFPNSESLLLSLETTEAELSYRMRGVLHKDR